MRLHLRWLACAILAVSTPPAAALAAPAADVVIDDQGVFPESLSSTRDGALYIGSIKGVVFRALRREAKATAWIRPTAANGLLSILGVLVDERRGTLWVCSAPSPIRTPPAVGVTALMAFDLHSGARKAAYPFPPPAGACNDVTIGKDGATYATDTPNGRIFRLRPGGRSLELYASDPQLKGIDGIVFGGDGKLYVNIVGRGALMRVDRGADGAVTGLTELQLSQPVAGPDGFRLIAANRFLLAEGNSGRIDEVTIDGDRAQVRVLRDGLVSPPGVTMARGGAYGLEGKILYLVDPRLKGQDPGPFAARAIPLRDGE